MVNLIMERRQTPTGRKVTTTWVDLDIAVEDITRSVRPTQISIRTLLSDIDIMAHGQVDRDRLHMVIVREDQQISAWIYDFFPFPERENFISESITSTDAMLA